MPVPGATLCRLAFALVLLVWLPSAASAEDCAGARPWINEVDYDSDDGGFNDDRDEFVEIAAPIGSDLGGYEIVSVEGNGNLFSFCLTGAPGVTTGNEHFSVVLPPGTIAGKHNGTGVGFVVVCFDDTSANVAAAGDCDVVLPGDSIESNLRNGDLQNLDPLMCPDGVVLASGDHSYIDALSWEGLVPASGAWGPLFGLINLGTDVGDLSGVSLHKTSSAASQTFVSSEWAVSGAADSATPGAENPGQAILCDSTCGNGFVEAGEACDDGNLLDGDGCTMACVIEFCGDGTTQPGAGEECDDGNQLSDDGCSNVCIIEFCGDGIPQPGLGEECDDGNQLADDGCSNICAIEFCGDGIPQPGIGEECDDGNQQGNDGCSGVCAIEFCGDGVAQPALGEACDDGNGNEFDLCLSTCQPNQLPTLDGWGLLGLVLLLTTAGSAALRRTRRLQQRAS